MHYKPSFVIWNFMMICKSQAGLSLVTSLCRNQFMSSVVFLLSLSVCASALPKPPTSLVLSEVSAASVKLTWNSGNIDPVLSYVVQYKPKFAPDSKYEEIFDITDTEYTVRGLNAHTVYEFRVSAMNGVGRSMASSPVDVTTGELG